MKVSVILPVYNVEKYLATCLYSLVKQTLEDIEIICINDGSTDNSLNILKDWAQRDSRIKIIDKENEGQGVARNIGIEIAKGEYIGFVDPDDFVRRDMFEKMYLQAKNLNSDIVICDIERFYEETQKYTPSKFFENYQSPFRAKKVDFPAGQNIDKEEIYKTLLISPCYSWNKIYKREFIINNNIKFAPRKCYEDCIFIMQSHILANNISYIAESFYVYLIRKSSTLRSQKNIYDEFQLTYEEIKSYLAETGFADKFANNIRYFYNMGLFLIYKRTRDKQFKKVIMNKIKTDLSEADYKLFLKKAGKSLSFQRIFSLTNDGDHKILELLGFKIKFRMIPRKSAYPIDLVYCWVDGNDKIWQEEKAKWQQELGILCQNNEDDCRYVDNQELKYSLRSVAENIGWINHIYIVTNGQVPKWLDKNHPKITIVPHSEIMPADALPTFNSEAIETCIINIPNLSEHFIYANDDCFVFSKLDSDYFFDKNRNPKIRLVKQNWTKDNIEQKQYLQNITNILNIINKKYGKTFKVEPIHNMEAYRKSYYNDCINEFRQLFDETVYCKFRKPNTVQRIIVNLYSIIVKHCSYKYVRIRSSKTPLEIILANLISSDRLDNLIKRHSPKLKLLCINDNEKTKPEDRQTLNSYLETLFPDKQEWEL